MQTVTRYFWLFFGIVLISCSAAPPSQTKVITPSAATIPAEQTTVPPTLSSLTETITPTSTQTKMPTLTPIPPTEAVTPTNILTPQPRPVLRLVEVYNELSFSPTVLGADWEFLTRDEYGEEGTCLEYSAPSDTPKRSNTLIICANAATVTYNPATVIQENTSDWQELNSGLVFSGLGTVQIRAKMGEGTGFVTWLPVGDDSFSIQLHLADTIEKQLQDYYDKNLIDLFNRGFHRLLADAGIPIEEKFFNDDFANPKGWLVTEGEYGKVGYEQDGYALTLNMTNQVFVSTPNFGDVVDVSISVDTKEINGDGTSYYGVVCRYKDLNNFYMLRITSKGFYSIAKYVDNQFTFFGGENWLLDENAILKGDQINSVRGDCIGNELSLYANGELLMKVTDSDLSAGQYGVVAGSFPESESVGVLFDNFSADVP